MNGNHGTGARWKTLLALAALALARPALATDVVQAPVPSALPDRQLTIADRTLALPEGEWHLVARAEGHITTQGINARSPHFTVYAMDAPQGRFRTGVVLRLPAASTPVRQWRDEPCKVGEHLFRDDFGDDLALPQCLVVFKRRTHLTSGADPFYAQARDWAAAQKAAPKGPFYEVMYARYASNDFGWIRVFLPASRFAGDDDAIAWARQLAPALARLFEKRDTEAALPPLARKDP